MTVTLHATGLVLGDRGLLIRGPSGSGKSLLALELMARGDVRGTHPRLVGDDRIAVRHEGGRLFMSGIEGFDGLIELRGRGLVRRPFVAEAAIHLIVDLVSDLPRLPDAAVFSGELLGHDLPRVPVPARPLGDVAHQALLVAEALAALRPQQHG